MKILLVQHLNFINGSGGTEKICSFLANDFALNGHEVEIATNQDISGKPVFPLHGNIKVTNIYNPETIQKSLLPFHNYHGKNPFLWLKFKVEKKKAKFYNKKLLAEVGGEDELFKFNLSQRSKDWKNYIEKLSPDIIITMSIGSLLEITYNNHYDIPIINSTNGRPDYDYTDILWYRSPIEMKLLKESYKKLSAIQVLFESYKAFLPETFQGKSMAIPNPVPQIEDVNIVEHQENKDEFKIVNIASLVTSCKQQDIAIDIFAGLSNKFPKWKLYFWGVGPDFELLKEKIKKYHLEDRILLMGFTDNPLEKLKESDIFIFPSKYEGFGLALAEAMSIGLPSIGFKSCSGVNELIKHNISGFLAQDKAEFENYLESLMKNAYLRSKLGRNAHYEIENFAPDKILDKWNLLLKDFISEI
ncbi:glycosyltransferase [Chryseobacterium sp. PMSZPI]|uniref:glycosyltransferase n=1 Tax=Chryseobacterium sp. PMSZPI TaxID=1033900 RepID=UPI000C32FB04|nr:glycosyltransferase [Chryseobacterium sp. PMSZPI]PKF74734.1 glycosyltransferase [Chryseobacterium sp. PMSZPI]